MSSNDIDPIEECEDEPAAAMAATTDESDGNIYYRMGFDLGTTNFAYHISAIPSEDDRILLEEYAFGEEAAEDSTMILPMGRFKEWAVITLEGIDVPTWIVSMCKVLSEIDVIKNDRVAEVYIEQQLPEDNVICHGLYGGLVGFFGRHAALHKSGLPRIIRTPNAQLKFSFFGVRCPAGKDRYRARKDLSVFITNALFNMWEPMGLIDKRWVDRFREYFASKPDDASDSFLLTYTTAMAEEHKYKPSAPAMKKLHDWLCTQGSFVQEGLMLTVNATKKYERYVRKKSRPRKGEVRRRLEPGDKRVVPDKPLVLVLSGAVRKKRSAEERKKKLKKKKKKKGKSSDNDNDDDDHPSERERPSSKKTKFKQSVLQ